jgi:hypothetical protein
MSASQTTTQMPLPPPRQFQLLDGTGLVGWINETRVQFTGFANPTEASAAAWVAHVGLERRRAKRLGKAPPTLESPRLFLVRSGGDEWITATGKRLARLVRPNPQDNAHHSQETAEVSARWFAFEIGFPPGASELTVGSGAYVIYLALRRSGLAWSARSHDSVLAPAPGSAALRAADHRIAFRSREEWRTAYGGIGG